MPTKFRSLIALNLRRWEDCRNTFPPRPAKPEIALSGQGGNGVCRGLSSSCRGRCRGGRSGPPRPKANAGKTDISGPASLLARLLAHDDRRSEQYTYIVFVAGPILGSLVSFAVNIGAAGGVVKVLKRIIFVSRDRFMLALAMPLYAYSVAYLLSLAVNPAPSLHYLFPVLTFLLFPFLYSAWCPSPKESIAGVVVNACMIACFGALALALFQFHIYGARAEGGAGNPIVFATATCLAASVVLAGAFTASGRTALLLFVAYCAGSIAILYSGSRMTWLALFVSTAAIVWIYRARRRAWDARITLSLGAIAFGALVFVGSQTVPERVEALVQDWRQMTEAGDRDSSLGHRIELWKIAVSAIRQAPALGHGPQATKPLIREGLAAAGLDSGYSHFHNGFLNGWVEAGIVGGLSLAALLFVAAFLAVRTLSRTSETHARLGAVMLIALVATYLVNGMTGILVGHDIIDALLVAYLAVGAYLAGGVSRLPPAAVHSELEHDLPVEPSKYEQRRDQHQRADR